MGTSHVESCHSTSNEGGMQWLIEIYGFLAVLIRGLMLASEGITAGGVIFLTVCLKRDEAPPIHRACVRLLRWSAMLLAAAAVSSVALSALVLHNSASDFTWADALHTTFSLSGLLIGIMSVAIAWLARRPRTPELLALTGLVIAAAVTSSHAFARVDNRPLLLLLTALHHLGMAAWIGGLPYLLITLVRGGDELAARVARRFSRLAIASVLVLCVAGLTMAQRYLGGLSALYGASYGVMVAAKAILLGLLLLLGASNFRLLRRHADTLRRLKMTRSVEVEVAVGIVTILAAASLTSQPPAIDLVDGRATSREIIERFTPRWSRLNTPPLSALSPVTPLNEIEAKVTGLPLPYVPGSAYQPDTPADMAWSEYNHNWAGLCVLMIGILATLAQSGRAQWARHWPLGFLGLALFLLIRSDSENWPLGPRGFWESFQVAEVAQHRFFVLLIVLFAFFEWQVATRRSAPTWRPLVFPATCLMGGALLLTHTHPLGNVKQALLAELSHTSIALLAVAAAACRWLELRLPRRPAALGFVWPVCFVAIGMILTFYRES
jgi:copper resistance protein D